jgi:hypothetical protein
MYSLYYFSVPVELHFITAVVLLEQCALAPSTYLHLPYYLTLYGFFAKMRSASEMPLHGMNLGRASIDKGIVRLDRVLAVDTSWPIWRGTH